MIFILLLHLLCIEQYHCTSLSAGHLLFSYLIFSSLLFSHLLFSSLIFTFPNFSSLISPSLLFSSLHFSQLLLSHLLFSYLIFSSLLFTFPNFSSLLFSSLLFSSLLHLSLSPLLLVIYLTPFLPSFRLISSLDCFQLLLHYFQFSSKDGDLNWMNSSQTLLLICLSYETLYWIMLHCTTLNCTTLHYATLLHHTALNNRGAQMGTSASEEAFTRLYSSPSNRRVLSYRL